MSVFLFNLILIFAEGDSAWGKFLHFWDTYANYPGFEAWKFLNLAIFIYLMYRFLNKPLSEAFKAKREEIRAELIKAEEQRQAALAQLTATEVKLAQLDTQSSNVLEIAKQEAESEKERIEKETENEIKKLREQGEHEIERAASQVKKQLRRFSAEESIRLAEEKIRGEMTAEKDARLVKTNIRAIGGLN
jgi:ATP synthase F0 subunit b